jgi:hypothetical protein
MEGAQLGPMGCLLVTFMYLEPQNSLSKWQTDPENTQPSLDSAIWLNSKVANGGRVSNY